MESPPAQALAFQPFIASQPSFFPANKFRFLNVEHDFQNEIDWNFRENGHLWAYNLNYFEWLNQPNFPVETGLKHIHDFIQKTQLDAVGFEPFPTSLRLISWIKFLLKNKIERPDLRVEIHGQANFLSKNLEYHLLANHLLENGFALFFAAFYLRDRGLLRTAECILEKELDEQFTRTGAHFELSPMYHAIMLHRMLDCWNLLKNNPDFSIILSEKLEKKIRKALGWLEIMTFPDGNFPMVNDSAPGIALTTLELKNYAKTLGIEPIFVKNEALEPGYRMFRFEKYTCFVDAAPIGPNYQPGHAHSDSLNFVLHIGKQPILVDPGISTYEKNARRQLERSTKMHNTVNCNAVEQTDIWGGFRVGKRAKTSILDENEREISVALSAYERFGVAFSRKWAFENNRIQLHEQTKNPQNQPLETRYHFHPAIKPIVQGQRVEHALFSIFFEKNVSLSIEKYGFAEGWNRVVEADVLITKFSRSNKVSIEIA